jgi:hypothetical protein
VSKEVRDYEIFSGTVVRSLPIVHFVISVLESDVQGDMLELRCVSERLPHVL